MRGLLFDFSARRMVRLRRKNAPPWAWKASKAVGSRSLPRDRFSPKERRLGGDGLALLRQGEGCGREKWVSGFAPS